MPRGARRLPLNRALGCGLATLATRIMPDFAYPLALFEAAVNALNAEDWTEAAAFVDPVSLRLFARQIRERLAPEMPQSTLSADDYMRHDPQLPRAVAEHYAAEARRLADLASQIPRELRGIESVQALRALTPEDLFSKWLDARSFRRQIEQLAADGRISQRAFEARNQAGYADSYQYVPIGMVADGARIAHVLYRTDVDPEQAWSGDHAKWMASQPEDEQLLARELWAHGHPRVATVRRQADGTWRFVMEQHDFLGVGHTHIGAVSVRENESGSESEPPAT